MYRAIAANKRNTVVIIAVFIVLIGVLGLVADYLYGGGFGIFAGTLIGAAAYTLFQYFAAGSQALAMAGAHPIQKSDNPRLYRIVENLAITEGLPMPKVYLVDDPAPYLDGARRLLPGLVVEALDAGADVIMLDNMSVDDMKKAARIAKGRAVIEASGNVNLENIRSIAETGVDIISIGALTHSARAVDISMKIV